MRFSVETWAPEYGIAVDFEALDEPDESVDATVERALGDWAPIAPTPAELPEHIAFVDGVRRIDARVWIHDGNRSHPAVCASVAAGVVRCSAQRATVDEVGVDRMLVASARSGGEGVTTRHATYSFTATPSDDPDDVYLAIHRRMTLIEQQLAPTDCDVVVFDGPLRGRTDAASVGYVKTQQVLYLPDDVAPVLGHLGDGERTPLILIGGRQGFTRWSWYLQLPGVRSHPHSGLIRCELPATVTGADAFARADMVSAMLPRYASEPHKEPRAPQNLYPIAGLENTLRRRLGDPLLLERSLRVAAAA